MIAGLFHFKTILDEKGNEYVLFLESQLTSAENIQDRTQFEAIENHVHLLNNVKKEDFSQCVQTGKILAQSVRNSLCFHYPRKQFIVYVSLRLNDSMILRFHQKWENEEPYYDPEDFNSEQEKVIKFET